MRKSTGERCEGVFGETEFPLSVEYFSGIYENTRFKSTNTPATGGKGKPCTHLYPHEDALV